MFGRVIKLLKGKHATRRLNGRRIVDITDYCDNNILKLIFASIDWSRWGILAQVCQYWRLIVTEMITFRLKQQGQIPAFAYSAPIIRFHQMVPSSDDIIAFGQVIDITAKNTANITTRHGGPPKHALDEAEQNLHTLRRMVQRWASTDVNAKYVTIQRPSLAALLINASIDNCSPESALAIIDQLMTFPDGLIVHGIVKFAFDIRDKSLSPEKRKIISTLKRKLPSIVESWPSNYLADINLRSMLLAIDLFYSRNYLIAMGHLPAAARDIIIIVLIACGYIEASPRPGLFKRYIDEMRWPTSRQLLRQGIKCWR